MTQTQDLTCDVAIIGGGPAGSTLGTLLKTYKPALEVVILEREVFPREHVGESQLPPISDVLAEMGCWDKVEAAAFPIKIGATYRWGRSPDLWDFEFLPIAEFKDEPRPANYEGQRRQTAFQVERALYDQILLDHAAERGVEVRQGTKVAKIERDGDRVAGLLLADGQAISARHYVDASGGTGVLRRAMGVEVDAPTRLRNIAVWDYWENAEWAVEIGVGGTRVMVLSIATGWIWFIPLGPTRTSIGFICPAEHAKTCGKSTEELYRDALAEEPLIAQLTAKGTREGTVRATKDWSFLAERLVGENWMLAGESAGFADPILAAGMTLAHVGAKEAAYTILALEEGTHEADWLKANYEETQKARITQHIRFADFWYSANGQFTDLQDYTAEIARDAGLKLSPREAFQWLGTGGFTRDVLGQAGLGGLDLAGVKQITGVLAGSELDWEIGKYNRFRLNLSRAKERDVPLYRDGKVLRQRCYEKGTRFLPITGIYALMLEILGQHQDAEAIFKALVAYCSKHRVAATPRLGVQHALQALEIMVAQGWVTAKMDKRRAKLNVKSPAEGQIVHPNRDIAKAEPN